MHTRLFLIDFSTYKSHSSILAPNIAIVSLLVRFSTDFTSTAIGTAADAEERFDPELAVELLLSQLWDLGSTGILREGDDRFVAGFDDEPTAQAAVAHLRKVDGPVDGSISVGPAPTADQWQPDTEPTDIAIDTATGPIHLAIRAGGAFGHGGHPTTELALALLCGEVERRVQAGKGTRVLDVGTGTGILALAAAATGAQPVAGVDNDPVAVEMAVENLTRNRERGLIPVEADITFDDRTLSELAGTFDVVAINVLLPVHRELAGAAVASLAPGAALITAGYLVEQEDELVALYGQLDPVERLTEDDWVAHRFQQP